jgi:hypothetical protein
MKKPKSSLKKTLITNMCLAVIIALVYIAAFIPSESLLGEGPALKGSTGENVVGLQIVVEDESNIAAYLDTLERYGVKGTFFFSEHKTEANEPTLSSVAGRGHGVGYYISENTRASTLYIGGGYSIPVMSYAAEDGVREVCPSVDVSKLSQMDDWTSALSDTLAGDMFIYILADNNFDDFEKVVQIVLDKGYTILKINEML